MDRIMGKYSSFMKRIIKRVGISDDDRYGRQIVTRYAEEHLKTCQKGIVLDLAAGQGDDLRNIRSNYNGDCDLYALDAYPPNVKRLREMGVNVYASDIERQIFPFEDGFFDVIIANQILEHCKELFWIFTEVQRVLKPGGVFIVGVPNLAASHNRLMLMLGMMPPCIETLGSHVRGFTYKDFKWFIETGEYFIVEEFDGSGRYGFIPLLSKGLSRAFPKSDVGLFLKIRRTDKTDGRFLDILQTLELATNFYVGEGAGYEYTNENEAGRF